ncbi:MAG TPA: trypsin-like peptidase domain-containing protein [Lysobacter sp.]
MDSERAGQIARMLAASEEAREHGLESFSVEGALGPDAAPLRPGDLLGLVDANLSRPPEVGVADWEKARTALLKHADGALSKLAGKDHGLAADEGAAMEALIIADGSRPSFLLCDGAVDPADRFMGTWGGAVATAEASGIKRLAAAVGRIQPRDGHASRYVGTGSLVDREKGLILTNYHVIAMAKQLFQVGMRQEGGVIHVEGHLEIDFAGESCSLRTNRFRIVEVLLPAGVGEGFGGLDVVVARLEMPADRSALPAAVPVLSADPAYAGGALETLAVVGFPAAPETRDGRDVDWNFVLRTLFANRFGVKRLAPGRFSRALGSHPRDASMRRAIGHDATTFGGASGALVAAWLDQQTPCFAIHFGGATQAANYALSFAVANTALQPLGVGF